jgi:hypothetical protein
MLLFAHFHVLGSPVSKFEPDFTCTSSGEYGRREWYGYHCFWGSSVDVEMCYDSKCLGLNYTCLVFISADLTCQTIGTDSILCTRRTRFQY